MGLLSGQDFGNLRSDILTSQSVDAVILPATAFGGSAAMAFSQTQALLIAVEDNQTAMQSAP